MPECTNCTGEPQVPFTEKPDTTKPDTTEHEAPLITAYCWGNQWCCFFNKFVNNFSVSSK